MNCKKNKKKIKEEKSKKNKKMLKKLFFKRQNILFNTKKFEKKIITIIGLGGLGSNLFENLIRLGFKNFILVEDDKVEETNIHRTTFFYKDIGKYKVEVLKKNVKKIYK